MKKIIVALFSVSCGLLLSADTLNSFSFRGGYHDWKDSESVDSSSGFQAELRLALGESPFDFVLRGYGSYTEMDDDNYNHRTTYGHNSYTGEYLSTDDNITTVGGSVQLQFNFARGALINPYIAAGGMYEYIEREVEVERGVYARSGDRRVLRKERESESEDDDGFAFVGRAGVEIYPKPIYLRCEGAFVSELYKDDSQAELNAVVGVDIMENLRLEVSGTYYTDWKEYYILVGASCLF